jgi:hypothetical protein
MSREGPFWDVTEALVKPPAAAAEVRVSAIDPEAGAIAVAFTATDGF